MLDINTLWDSLTNDVWRAVAGDLLSNVFRNTTM